MTTKTGKSKGFSVKAYPGDAKTLLAFNLPDRKSATNLAGFTIQCTPDGQPAYYVYNMLQFQTPGQHAQDSKEPPVSSINAPIHKFRWLHVLGSVHQGTKPFYGQYTYTVTPRFFDEKNSLQPIDHSRSASVAIAVQPFQKNGLALGFTRGFTQSQAFVRHFGLKAQIRPKEKELLFKTSQISGTNSAGETYTFQDEYEWLGFSARERIFDVLTEVLNDKTLSLDVFAYDLNEPDLMGILLQLAKQGRVRIILDNAALHHSTKSPKPEDQFATLFTKAAQKPAAILRGKFNRYSHDKVFIVSKGKSAVKVLTGSTNFSVTGLYVNANHVLVFNDATVAGKYSEVFEEAWQGNVKAKSFIQSKLAGQTFSFSSKATPKTEITFSPHDTAFATQVLNGMVTRIKQEGKKGKATGSVLFAVMQLDKGTGPVYPALRTLHANQSIFSYGISDSPGGIYLYKPDSKTGLLVTGKPVGTRLPAPFDQVPNIGGVGHQIHHKFVVCGFNGDDPVVYCGSSNLALGGEESNGDNLIAIHDGDVATVFAIEALALVDHFQFLDRSATGPKGAKRKPKFASKEQAAVSASWFLSTSDKWVDPYFDPKDIHCVDRQLFG
jgi:phosphatidylserine/phosphatidylglycerophosphate/cardiolipin synthase-like enzyme